MEPVLPSTTSAINSSTDLRTTERRNPRTVDIDLASAETIVDLINSEDRLVADAVSSQRLVIGKAVDAVERAFRAGGRLVYAGAGTSGRLGVLDASECPPTFGTPPGMVIGCIAGGDTALRTAVEGAEDNPSGGADDMERNRVDRNDVVIGIAASGTTPYVLGALLEAKRRGATTGLIACSEPPQAMRDAADILILPIVGPEVLTGSTRMKAGTAQKLVLNTITTGAMIRIGKSYGNLMVDLRATNAKLTDRAERMMMEVAGLSRESARDYLSRAGGAVKRAIVMHALGVDADFAQERLDRAGGVVRRAIDAPPPPVSESGAGADSDKRADAGNGAGTDPA